MDERKRLALFWGELARRELARRFYSSYLELVYGAAWIPTRFSLYLAAELQRFLSADTGNAYDILILETPPQHGKSWTLTEALPSWAMGRNPDLRVILASYSDESAERFARRNRDKLRAWGPFLFGVEPGGVSRAAEFELVPAADGEEHFRFGAGGTVQDRDAVQDIGNVPDGGNVQDIGNVQDSGTAQDSTTVQNGGTIPDGGSVPDEALSRCGGTGCLRCTGSGPPRGRLISRGILAGITGNPADLLIIDDPVKNREEADSPVWRQKLWAEWVNSLKSRLAAGAKVILVMTPWHEDDLAARILRTERNVRLLRFPVEAEAHPPDPLGRDPGDPLCPELGKGKAWLEQFKQSYLSDPRGGQRAWLALYLCRPRAESGNLVRRNWWRFYDTPPECPVQCVSVDAAFKDGERNDFAAVTVWGKRGEDYYLLDCRNRHLDFLGTLDEIRSTARAYPKARTVLIEDKANGSALVSVLRRELFCVPVEPKGGKAQRVLSVSPAVESGHVYLPRNAPWLEEFLDQWTAFPAAAHDDMVDSSTQALRWLLDIRAAPERTVQPDGAAVLTDAALYQVY